MKKNIIFDKNVQQQNGIDVTTLNATNIIVETVSQTGNLDISGNLTVTDNITSSGNLNVVDITASNITSSGSINGLLIETNTNNGIFIAPDSVQNLGYEAIGIGFAAMNHSTNNYYCVALGDNTLGSGNFNYCTAIGMNSMRFDVSGNNNTAIGYQSGSDALNTYNYSTAVGSNATYTGSNQIVLGTSNETTIIKGNLAVGGLTSVSTGNVVDISGSALISDNLIVNGSVSGYNMNVSNNLSVGNDINSKLYNGATGTINISNGDLATQTFSNGMDNTGSNSGLQIGWNYEVGLGETDFVNWSQGGSGGFNFYSIGQAYPMKLLASLCVNGISYISDNLGIGKTNPAYTLDVSGNINFNGNLYQNGTIFSGGATNNFTGNVDISGGNLTVAGNILLNNGGPSSQLDYISLSPSTNATASITLSQTNVPDNGFRCGIADGATSTTCNVQINSNYGVGFYYSGGNPGVYNIWFDVRLGTINATTFNSTSDRRIKKDIQNINLIESIQDLKPRYYYNKISKKKEFGFIADELQEILPELVNGEINQYDKDNNPILQSINYTQLIPLLVYYIQKLEKRIQTLENFINKTI